MRIFVVTIFCFVSLLVGFHAFGQGPIITDHDEHSVGEPAPALPAAPAATINVIPQTHNAKGAHGFFDVKNALAFTAVGISLAGDGWSTQRALAIPGTREVNPVARPFVSTRTGEIAYSSASFALVVGGLYLAHRTHHHRWERIGPFALAGWESLLTAWNLHLGR